MNKRKRKQGEGGIVVKLFIYFFYVNNLCTVFLPSSLLNARFHFHLIHPHLIIQCKVSFSSHFILLGGFIVNMNKWYDFEMWALFSFPISERIWPKCGYMLKQIVFGSFYHPFQDGYKNFRKTGIVSVASPGQDTSYLNRLLQSFPVCQNCYQKLVFCWDVFWQIHKFQIHKLVSRRDHLNISTMYSVFDWKEF